MEGLRPGSVVLVRHPDGGLADSLVFATLVRQIEMIGGSEDADLWLVRLEDAREVFRHVKPEAERGFDHVVARELALRLGQLEKAEFKIENDRLRVGLSVE